MEFLYKKVYKNTHFFNKKVYKFWDQNKLMYEALVVEEFRKLPVFALADVNQIINNRGYAKKFLKRMVERKKIFRIKRDCYTLHNDPFLISTFVLKPSYISSISALSYHGLITQIPNEIFCFTNKKTTRFNFGIKINFIYTKYFFGFEIKKYNNFKIPVADPEKAIIDTIGLLPISTVEEAVSNVNEKKMVSYLERIGKSCIVKRLGFVMERNGFDVYERLRSYLNKKYTLLDPVGRKRGKKNKKWFVIENG